MIYVREQGRCLLSLRSQVIGTDGKVTEQVVPFSDPHPKCSK
jgi:hypothetical protein